MISFEVDKSCKKNRASRIFRVGKKFNKKNTQFMLKFVTSIINSVNEFFGELLTNVRKTTTTFAQIYHDLLNLCFINLITTIIIIIIIILLCNFYNVKFFEPKGNKKKSDL